MTRNEGLVNFGKQAATSLASTAIGGIGPTEGAFTALEAGQKVGLTLGRQLGTNLSSGLINSIEYSAEDGFGWNGEALAESMVGEQALAGYMGTVMGGAIQHSMTDSIRGTIGEDLMNAQATARTAGNLARMGIDLAVTGNTGINLLNANGVGLFEMNFDLEQGISGRISMGGYDMSAGTIMSAINGMSTYKTSRDILNQGFSGDRAAAMRMLASYAADETDERFEQLMNGDAEFTIEEGDGNAKTEQDENGRISMRIDSQEGTNGDLLTGIALIHEAFRNGLDDGEIGQQQENAESVIHHTIAAQMVGQGYGMSSLSDSLKDEIKILNSEGGIQKLAEHAVENYDWSADYWKLTAEGKWKEDQSLDFDISAAVEENPELLNDPEIMALLRQGGGKIAFSDMNEEVAQKIGLSIFGDDIANSTNPNVPDWANESLISANGALNRFIEGTGAFVNASEAINSAISYIGGSNYESNPINSSIANTLLTDMMDSLGGVQDSGLLVKNGVSGIDTSNLVNLGTDENPLYIPVELGPGQSVHDSSSLPGLRDMDAGIFKNHSGIDLRGIGDSNVVSSADNLSMELNYDATFGLNALTTFNYSGISAQDKLSHLEAEPTIMSFLQNFGTEGVNFDGNALSGLIAGTVLGNVGNTGYSDGAHLDWNTLEYSSDLAGFDPNSPLDSTLYGDYLRNDITVQSAFARYRSGGEGTPETVLDYASNLNNYRNYFEETNDIPWMWEMNLNYGLGWDDY
ncbi:hypothetical protein [Salinispira pacifica]|uniref:Uncharacterized protein n=1 Tax=Salinispira pacifica TaxID=1307761 RepID=V5WFQ5_9SPIO|nr:hypothetical protein [Salinispira pacifica]AHC14394.1 hypothetical protein L21SP2_0974 [Salinispira pacifica]